MPCGEVERGAAIDDVEISDRIRAGADSKTVAPWQKCYAQVPVFRILTVCGEVAERLKAEVLLRSPRITERA
jgi:hypothetical protein